MKIIIYITVVVIITAGYIFKLTAVPLNGGKDGTAGISHMVLVKGGFYIPLYKKEGEESKVKINSFLMDKYPVTNSEYLEFVKANPKWQRSSVKKIFADNGYLKHWKSDLDLGSSINAQSPVTNISWFAANAYAEWKGKRLPTVAEWEYAASASLDSPDGSRDQQMLDKILAWYSKRSDSVLPPIGTTDKNYWGIYDLFGIIWEWNYDFNTALVTGESRGDSDIDRNTFCGSGASAASNANNYPAFMRYGFRSSLKANYTVHNLGFRCAKDLYKK